MTQIGYESAGGIEVTAIFALINPAIGNYTLSCSWTGNLQGYMSGIAFSGTDTVTGYRSADTVNRSQTTNGPYSIPVNTDSAGATVVILGNNGGQPAASNQTQIFTSGAAAPNAAASYALGGSSQNTHSFSGGGSASESAWTGIHIIAPAGVAGYQPQMLLLGA